MTDSIRDFRGLLVWQRAMDLVAGAYTLTRSWPREELFGLTSQIRRAVISVPTNIAEGQGRTGAREYLHHLSIAHGSLREVETCLMIAVRLGYADDGAIAPLMADAAEVGRLLQGLIRRLRQ